MRRANRGVGSAGDVTSPRLGTPSPGRVASGGPPRRERDPSLPPRITRGRGDAPGRQALGANRPLRGMQTQRTPQYLVIGHIVADLLPDGTAVLGGTALYSALTAARLGWRVGVLTRGAYGRTIDGVAIPSLEEFADEISIISQDAESPTVFVNEYAAGRRTQTIRTWAGSIDLRGLPPHWGNARVAHLGPVAQEIDPRQVGSLTASFLGATPQGWMREWPRGGGGRVKLGHLRLPAELMGRLDAIVVSDEEIHLAREAVERVGARRLGVVTLGEQGARIVYGGQRAELPGVPVKTADLTGAGDVFAAAFFVKAADRDVSAVTAGRFANAVAALSLRGVGPSSVPSLAEVEALLADETAGRR
ncbi:MAG: PfkB [uncultured Thermomicrobiales bacterium]|uniref:PfkB n=1 Tax=uncultured Thermomicrobiales bacterium TaxID=1645740 RepID=A0A6J4VQ90_9BACT|nr:MAG: PfkB [uncultured Thermomicrobiales bacterium]